MARKSKKTEVVPQEKTVADRVYRALRDDIISGRLPPGHKLKLERLAQGYDVAMSPLREALFQLVGDSLVVSQSQRGFWVAPLSLADLDDLTNVRALVECQALSDSIQKGGEYWSARVDEAYNALAEIELNFPVEGVDLTPALMRKWEARNQAFHDALTSASGSPWLTRLRDLLYRQSVRYRSVSLRSSRGSRHVHDEHEQIYLAVKRRDTLRACGLLDSHIRRTAAAVRQAMPDLDATAPLQVRSRSKR